MKYEVKFQKRPEARKKAGKFEGRMLDLENLPALLCKAHKLKWFDLYTSQTDTVKYAQKDCASIGECS